MEYIVKEELLAKAKEKLGGVFAAPVIVNLIEKAPVVDVVEVKHGGWITPTKIKSMTIAVPHCSVCGLVPCDKGLYCPNCGAKMDLKEVLTDVYNR